MARERDEVWGTPARRTLAFGSQPARPAQEQYPAGSRRGGPFVHPAADALDPHGPEAVARAREMDYELTTRIQQESPYAREEFVEHRVHDFRLYVGMWVVAGLCAVAAFLTYSLWQAGIAAVAVVFALTSSPGRQYRDDRYGD